MTDVETVKPQRILIILKPEILENFLLGEILSRFDKARLVPIAMKQLTATQGDMMAHYTDCYKKYGPDITNQIVKRMTRGPCVFIIYQDYSTPLHYKIDLIKYVRDDLIGATDPSKAAKGTIRGDFATDIQYNLIHASDSAEAASREIDLWFPEMSS
jgi:nucleoside-diphosphate kinase